MSKTMKLPTLFEISNEYKLALAELVDLEDDAVVDTLDALKGTLEVKAGNVSAFIRTLESTSSAMKRAEGQIAQRRLVLDRKIDRITKYIKTNMLNAGIKKSNCPNSLFRSKITHRKWI